jgi:hypothetical protein
MIQDLALVAIVCLFFALAVKAVASLDRLR